MKFQTRRLTKILRRRSTKSPKVNAHRASMFKRRATVKDCVQASQSSSPSSSPTESSRARRRTTTTLNLHPGVSHMMNKYKNDISKKILIQPPPWCSECQSARASKCCEMCGPTLFFCERCARALHLGIRSKRNHVLEPHPDFKSFEGYKGPNDPSSPAYLPIQKCVSELRPLTRLNTSAATSPFSISPPQTVFQKIMKRRRDESFLETHSNSRPKYRVRTENYEGDVVMFTTHLIHGDRRDVEVKGRVLEIRHTTGTRRSYLVRFTFKENGFERTGLQLVAESNLETVKENRKRKLRHATRCILHGKTIKSFEKWRDMMFVAKENEDRLAAAIFLQRIYRGHHQHLLFLQRRDAHREEIRRQEREKRRNERERERKRRELFGGKKNVVEGDFAIGQVRFRTLGETRNAVLLYVVVTL